MATSGSALEKEIGHGNAGLVPWSAFSDVTESVPELAWPNSISTYSAMRTDAQIASLLLAFTLPIRRYGWFIDPNGARDEVVELVANDMNLPIEGQDPKPTGRRRDRFSHDRHLSAVSGTGRCTLVHSSSSALSGAGLRHAGSVRVG